MKRLITAALMSVLTLPNIAVCGQSPVYSREWARLQKIPVGQALLVELQSGKRVKGRFRSASDTSLELTTHGGTSAFGAENVLRVYWPVGRHVASSTLIGTGGGVVMGYIVGKEAWNDGSDAARGARTTGICIAVGAIVGALAGFIIGARTRHELIYENPHADGKITAVPNDQTRTRRAPPASSR